MTEPEQCFLLIKRGLYYGPNNQGYTGVKTRAGRYREVDALGLDGVTAIHEDKAPMFSGKCWDDIKVAYLEKQLAAFAEREARLVGALETAGSALAWAESRMAAETYAIVIRNDLRNVRATLAAIKEPST